MEIRKAEEKDWQGIFRFLSEIVKKGETYAINRDAEEEELKQKLQKIEARKKVREQILKQASKVYERDRITRNLRIYLLFLEMRKVLQLFT